MLLGNQVVVAAGVLAGGALEAAVHASSSSLVANQVVLACGVLASGSADAAVTLVDSSVSGNQVTAVGLQAAAGNLFGVSNVQAGTNVTRNQVRAGHPGADSASMPVQS